MSESMKDRSLDEIRAAYREYLTTQGLSLNTIMASSTDAFFIWRKRGLKAFWQIVLSDEFESLGKDVLLDLLQQQPDGNAKANMSRYMSHLRRFRRYVESSSNVDMPATVTDKPVPTAVKTTQLLLPPSVEQVEHYLGLWDSLEDYRLQEAALNRLFFSLCDLVVNGKKKSLEGKGYRAFLNTVLAFVMMKYLSVYAIHAPRLLVLDSPILSLLETNENDEEIATEGMKASLFRYMLENQSYGQIIIAENEIPNLDYSNANVIRFTKDPDQGRYGFLYDYKLD